jgi:hypothetical protein
MVVVVGRPNQMKFPSVSQFHFIDFSNFKGKQACLEM